MNLNTGSRSTNNQQPTTNNHSELLAVLGLALLLFGLTYGVIGFYYETNDDQIITLLLRGLSIRPAGASLSIYFFGFSQVLAWLYAVLPQVPWYGVLLYGWLLVATALAFWLLLRAFPQGKPWQQGALLCAFFFFCWLEHVMWFNYLRVPLLLAGTSFLFLLCRQAPAQAFRWWPWLLSGGLFLAALCIRPSAAILGFLVVAPAALLGPAAAGAGRRAWVLIFFLALALAFSGWRQVSETPAARQYQQLDLWKSAILDYDTYQPRVQGRADSLAFAAISHWLLADQQVLNTDFYQQHGRIDGAYIFRQAPRKVWALLEALVRDQFFVLLVNALLFGWLWAARVPDRRRRLVYGLYCWLLLLAIGIALKLPPRVLTPCLSLFTLVQLGQWPRTVPLPAYSRLKVGFVLLVVAGLGYLAKVSHRVSQLQQRRQAHERVVAEVARLAKGRVLVYSVLPDYLRALSPLRNYDFGTTRLFPLTGWSTLDPGYAGYYQRLSGEPTFVAAVLALSRQQGTVWLLEPGFHRFLQAYLQEFHGAGLRLVPQGRLRVPYPVEVWTPPQKPGLDN